MKITIITLKGETAVLLHKPTPVMDLIRQLQLPFFLPCGGKGTCGGCRVHFLEAAPPPDKREKKVLSQVELARGVRLACRAVLTKDCTIDLREGQEQVMVPEQVVTDEKQDSSNFGIGVDIGTTTVAVSLVRLSDGEKICSIGETNVQVAFGADVISRINYATKMGVDALKEAILNQLESLFTQIAPKGWERAVITGNTVMLHFLTGKDPTGMGRFPFTPKSLFGETITIQGRPAYLPRCLSAFVGADLSCGILASGMLESSQTALILDVGTNGEMALFHHGKLFCTSTAAGPAFEGAGILCGVAGIPGAISKVFSQGANLFYKTIGDLPAVGICGSGIIDAMGMMVANRVVDEGGKVKEEGHPLSRYIQIEENGVCLHLGNSGQFITQKDVRKIQLAKAAIHAGINTLLREAEVLAKEVDVFYLAGGFGSLMDLKNAARIGLFPKEFLPKARVLGNSALTGAIQVLTHPETEKTIPPLDQINTIDLSTNSYFADEFLGQMNF